MRANQADNFIFTTPSDRQLYIYILLNFPTRTPARQNTFFPPDIALFKRQTLLWANQFKTLCYLDSNEYQHDKYSDCEALVAVGTVRDLTVEHTGEEAFEQLKDLVDARKSWLFGFLTYELKNDIERLESRNFDGIGMSVLHFFEPKYVIQIYDKKVVIHSAENDSADIFFQIQNTRVHIDLNKKTNITIQPRIPKNNYLNIVEKIRQHIIEGDLYEMNFCQEFFAENTDIEPLTLFLKLNELAKAPFSSFYKKNNQYLLCTSPERFLKKQGQQLISQPIKGTIRRGNTPTEDDLLKTKLHQSTKDRAENVMIVDLVRNDLTRSSHTGTIRVEELFGIYPFEQVNHMISTISSTLREDVHAVDAIRHAFPPGSMTGAPKVMSMELIELYEQTQRGLYSGAVGYFTPDGDFDFNVVIRSMLYNASSRYLSFQVGGAIVYDSVPEREYKECLLKAKAILQTVYSKM